MLAVVLLTSFSAKAGDLEDALDDLFESDDDSVTDFCKAHGNYEFTKDFINALPGPFILYLGVVHCFPQTVIDTAKKCNDQHTMISGWSGEEKSNRWWKGIFDTLSNAASKVTNDTWDKVASGAQKLLAVAFGLWLALVTLPMVASLKEQDPMGFLTKIGGMALKVMFAYGLLENRDWFFGFFVSPIIATAAGFVGVSTGSGTGVESVVTPLKDLMESMHTSLAEAKGVGKLLMSCLNMVDAFIIALGLDLWIIEIGTAFKIFDLPNIWVVFSGCALWISAVVLGIFFPFRVFDAVFRLGIILALSPLYIISWVFPLTKDFAVKGFNCILQVAFLFMFLKITLDLSIDLIFEASGIGDVTSVAAAGNVNETAKTLLEPFMTAAALGKILVIIICLVFCVMMLKKVDDLANTFSQVNFSSTVSDNIGAKIAAPAIKLGNAAKNAVGTEISSRVDAKAMSVMQDGKKDGTFRQRLARSYLHHRGVTNRDGSASGDGSAYKDVQANASHWYGKDKTASSDSQSETRKDESQPSQQSRTSSQQGQTQQGQPRNSASQPQPQTDSQTQSRQEQSSQPQKQEETESSNAPETNA